MNVRACDADSRHSEKVKITEELRENDEFESLNHHSTVRRCSQQHQSSPQIMICVGETHAAAARHLSAGESLGMTSLSILHK